MLITAISSLLFARLPLNRTTELPPDLFRSQSSVEHTVWDGNQISTWHGNHGDVVSYHVTGNSGLEWPKGSGKLAVFQSGIWLASGRSKVPGGEWEDEIRTAASEYSVEFVPGTINGQDGHIYEIHKTEVDAFLSNDINDFIGMTVELPITQGNERVTSEVQFPTPDFENWPAEFGAPWVDSNGDGIYNILDGDYPDILGDQFQWYVMNDGDAATHTPLWGTAPMDVEVQTSVFGFNQSGALGNILFIRWVIENKGDDELDSVFVSMWHDDDVGDATDDLVGCNVDLSLGYTYNDTDGDNSYGVEAPAAGADFFQGPIVPSVGDTASILTWSSDQSYHLESIPNHKKLPLTSFVKYINGNATYADPETSEETYRYMNGLIGLTGESYIDPITNEPSVFVHDGDPVAGTGWLDDTPGDRRYLMTSGPFSFSPGDVQEVVGCIILAAGSDWAKSITKLEYFDKFAQAAFDANFDVCSPPIPSVSVAQLDEKVILSFEEGSLGVENYSCSDYVFEGYNVYQGESPTGPWHRVTTFDLVNDIKTIMDLELDETTGAILELPSQFGTDSGIEHYIELTEDNINSGNLINGREYYYTVTAYAYDPDAAQRVIESPMESITAIPMQPGLGSDIESTFNDLLEINHLSGISGLQLYTQVIDPYQLTGDDYNLFFTESEDDQYRSMNETEKYWNLNRLEEYDDFDNLSDVHWTSSSSISVSLFNGNNSLFVVKSALDTLGWTKRVFEIEKQGNYQFDFLYNIPDENDIWDLYYSSDNIDWFGLGTLTSSNDTLLNSSKSEIISFTPGSYFFSLLPTDQGFEDELEIIIDDWSLNEVMFSEQTTFPSSSYSITDGFIITFDNATFDAPTTNLSAMQTAFGDASSVTNIEYSITDGNWSGFMAGYGLTGGTSDKSLLQKDIRFVFTEEPQKGYYWNGANNDPFEIKDLPFEIWTVEDNIRINAMIWILTGGQDVVHYNDSEITDSGDIITYGMFHNHKIIPLYTPYDTSGSYNAWDDGSDSLGWAMQFNKDATKFVAGDEFFVEYNNPVFPGVDEFGFTATGLMDASEDQIKKQMDAINVFPNPYFGRNSEETNPLERFVTFTRLGGGNHTIRIYNLYGDLVKKIKSENTNNQIRWDLRNNAGIPVASGIYLAYIETPHGNKVLKVAIMQPEERIDVY